MDVDDMFDLMKSLDGAKPVGKSEPTGKNIVKKQNQQTKTNCNKNTPVIEKNKDTGGAKHKSNTNRDQNVTEGVKPKYCTNQHQKPKENQNLKEDNKYLEKTMKSKDVNDMIDKTNTLTGAKPKNTGWSTKNEKHGDNTNLEDKGSLNNKCVDDMFDIMSSLNVEKPKVSDKNKRLEYNKQENVKCKVNNQNIKYKEFTKQERGQYTITFNSEEVTSVINNFDANFFSTNHLVPKALSLSRLKELCKEDILEAVFTLVDKKSGFLDIFHMKSLGSEQIFCTMNLLGKLCNSEDLRFNETILSPACSHEFLQNLQEFIGGIPVKDITDIKQQIGPFFEDVLSFVKTVSMVFPMTASHRMKKLFLSIHITIQHIQEHQTDINISEHVCVELKSLWDQLDTQNVAYNNTNSASDKSKYFYNKSFKDPHPFVKQANIINVKPPNHFRAISVYPTQKDLFSNESFLRENIVVGAYADVEHYLDVQFRLYKEDLVSPLREGLQEYLKNSSSLDQTKRINNIRYYSNVRFLGSEIYRGNFSCIVKFSKAKFKHIAWNTSKRLMCGSLLLFSNNDFKSFFLATVSSRDVKKLKQGLLTVRFGVSCDLPSDLFSDEFVMLESEVFFEPYYQVLTVLKQISRYSFPMEDYIINVSSEPSIPGKKNKEDEVDKWYLTIDKKRFNVFDSGTWPSHVDLGLDCSQYRAFKAALTSSFSVIQGPPGTGKTFIGLKIARALLHKYDEPILIVCYTNHALDQFLEGLLPSTQRLVRIGGQSKNENLKKFNIIEFRKRLIKQRKEMRDSLSKKGRKSYYYSYEASVQRKYYAAKNLLEDIMYDMLNLENKIRALQTSILSTVNFKQHFNRAQKRMLSDRVLVDWLTEELDFSDIIQDDVNLNTETEENVINLDELGSTESESSAGSYIEETDDSDTALSSDDDCFLEPNDIVFDFDEDPELVTYYSRKRPIKHEKRKAYSKIDNWKTRFLQSFEKQIEADDDGLIELNFESKLVNINKLIEKLANAKSKLNETKCNQNWKRIQCVRYEILDELNIQQKFLDHLEIEMLERSDIDEFKEEIDDKLEELLNSVKNKIVVQINTKKKYIAEKLSSKPDFNSEVVEKFTDCSNIWMVSPNDRWMLYHYWKNMYREKLMDEYSERLVAYEWEYRNFKTASQHLDVDILRRMDVIGLTTTSAARHHTMLENIGPKIVIVEEAAEVFEAHIVTTLTNSCEQVVLIGDHEQLRPSPSTYKLAKKYNLDISLFERMIHNGMCCYSLEVQHRMRPEIVSLIVPTIYKKLDNHESVLNRPDIKGIASNLYFVTHNYYEDKVHDSLSRRNAHEADFMISLCTYLLYQGYSADKITILTTYKGQMFYMKDLVQKQVHSSLLQAVRITVVDNYQGEENDIILMSLVRSNKESQIGFLATKNRICVALSRARDGFYIIGNMDNLTDRSTVWQEVKDQLQRLNAIGPALPLRCAVHSHHITRVSSAADFKKMHNGGCTLPCSAELKCGHVCRELCHIVNRNHVYDPFDKYSMRCNEIVEQMLLCGHERKLPCYLTTDDTSKCDAVIEYTLDCGHSVLLPCQDNVMRYRCKELINVILPCGHETMLPCTKNPDSYNCMEIVPHELELCGHTVNKCCWVQKVDPRLCEEFCGGVLPCGHDCEEVCHQYDDPDHRMVKCMKECTRTRKGCSLNHKCRKICNENCEPCNENVLKALLCGHAAEMKCKDDVTKFFCEIKCDKLLPCGHTDTISCGLDVKKYFCPIVCRRVLTCKHEVELPCGQNQTKYKCVQPCSQILNCGHKCQLICSAPCVCHVMVTNNLPKCKHEVTLPCHQYTNNTEPILSVKCQEPCEQLLACGHRCMGLCSESCDLIKCHEPCNLFLACGHKCTRLCSESCEINCEEPCTKVLECGHPCTGKCGESCHLICCDVETVQAAKTSCGHGSVSIKCSMFAKVSAKPSPDLMMFFCNEPCTAQLPCGHSCVGTCGACMQGKLHIPCNQNCTNRLICGHVCKALCKELCPPCSQQCLYSCEHGPCKNRCGDPCFRCQRKCNWQCPRESCTNLCFEICNRNPCNEPCTKTQICGHVCMGLCGEICPKLCRSCDNLDCSIYERYVVLEDCGHAIQSKLLDEMFQTPENICDIVVRTCPVCECIISKTKRYRNSVRMTCKQIKNVKDSVVTNLRLMSGQYVSIMKKDLTSIVTANKPYAWIADIFLQYLSNFYNGERAVIRKKYAATFLSCLVIELSSQSCKLNVTKSNQSLNLYDDLVEITVRPDKGEMYDRKHTLFTAKCLIEKMEQRLTSMSIHDMNQFYKEVLRLESLTHRFSGSGTESSKVELPNLMSNLDLSANVWEICPFGHIGVKQMTYLQPNENEDGIKHECKECKIYEANKIERRKTSTIGSFWERY